MSEGADSVCDLRGLKCPLPVLKLAKRLERIGPGDTLCVETTDPLAAIDVPNFCREQGHVVLETHSVKGGHRFRVRRGGQAFSPS